ncbi:MAG: malto-oligosyltrehalose trehalohydrolase [Nitrospirae bacterium]|nr:malto-oligosyltrehalose trehalohydrolase [Nitrospirota bacterium]
MTNGNWKLDLGASAIDNGRVSFNVWAPRINELSVRMVSGKGKGDISLKKDSFGYFKAIALDISAGDRYLYVQKGGNAYPDPASRFQPEGVHGPSEIVNPEEFRWSDSKWMGLSLEDYLIYELHVGTFTEEGTFEAVISKMAYLRDLGITAIELMPVSQFPGNRNWGYDGVYHFAPQNSYGGPAGLKMLIDACHRNGLAVILDVVYNHLGPEGNYLNQFGYYFTERYKTPWGDAINYDGPFSDDVRKYIISNALYWISEYHFDALRVDAIHGIFDFSARHILQELGDAVHREADALGRKAYVIPESDLNDVRVISPEDIGGYGLDAQWNDDYHHVIHTLITGEHSGYYEDFGQIEQLKKALTEGFVYSGQYSSFRRRRHGSSARDREAKQFIVFSQNHDQVGNRMKGDRLSLTQSIEKLKLAAAAVVLSPYIPLLFMGEEYGETAPFQYFVSHSDEALIDAVRKGRSEEFSSFRWEGDIPDPQDITTFKSSKINSELHRIAGSHRFLFKYYKEVIRLRKELPALSNLIRENTDIKVIPSEKGIYIRRWFKDNDLFYVFNFSDDCLKTKLNLSKGLWYKLLDSSSEEWGGRGGISDQSIESNESAITITINPHSVILFNYNFK